MISGFLHHCPGIGCELVIRWQEKMCCT